MISRRDFGMMLVGAALFHMIGHMIIAWMGILPLSFGPILLSEHLNMAAIIASGALAVGLFWWARNA